MGWPHLEVLDLSSEVGWLSRSRITLAGLVPLAEHCRSLQKLGIVVDADAHIPKPSAVHISHPSTSVRKLCLGNSTITDGNSKTIKIATLLARIFPRVEQVDAWNFKMAPYFAEEYRAVGTWNNYLWKDVGWKMGKIANGDAKMKSVALF
jgi:hypothetical protein